VKKEIADKSAENRNLGKRD